MEIYISNLSNGIREEDLVKSFSYFKNRLRVEIIKADGIERRKDFAVIYIQKDGVQSNSTPSFIL